MKKKSFYLTGSILFVSLTFAAFFISDLFNQETTYRDLDNIPAQTTEYTPQKLPMNKVFELSSHNKEIPPSLIIGSKTEYLYDPVLYSVLAPTKSRIPNMPNDFWQTIDLPATEYSTICPQSFKVFLKRSSTASPYTFVILPGYFTDLESGAFFNQTAHILNKQFNDPNIIALNGHLSPTFLKEACHRIIWNIHAMAEDLYSRLKQFLKNIPLSSIKTGIIGFSGGGSVVASLLGQDAQWNQETGEPKLFNLGGIAFSPVLHLRTTFNTLDEQHRASKNPDIGLTNSQITNLRRLGFSGLKKPLWEKIITIYKENPAEFRDRSFNELTVVDLRKMLESISHQSLKNTDLSYYDTFVINGFKKDQQMEGDSTFLNESFDKATDLRPFLESITSPFLIYISQDDPFVTYQHNMPTTESVVQVFETTLNNPYITLFNPQFGGHTGGLLDFNVEHLILSFFQKDSTNDEKNTTNL